MVKIACPPNIGKSSYSTSKYSLYWSVITFGSRLSEKAIAVHGRIVSLRDAVLTLATDQRSHLSRRFNAVAVLQLHAINLIQDTRHGNLFDLILLHSKSDACMYCLCEIEAPLRC